MEIDKNLDIIEEDDGEGLHLVEMNNVISDEKCESPTNECWQEKIWNCKRIHVTYNKWRDRKTENKTKRDKYMDIEHEVMLTQISAKAGVKKFGDTAISTMFK